MAQPKELLAILERIAKGKDTEADLQKLRDLLNQDDSYLPVLQVGKYAVNIQQVLGQVHVGDRLELTEENIQTIAQAIREEISKVAPSQTTKVASVDELVQQVRSRLHDDIECLHGTMPLWGIDHWVSLGELFVDVDILEGLSSSHRSELNDVWQDFSKNPDYRSLDRIGLGQERERVSGLKVLERNTNLMMVGKPGSGKTTYLQRVVMECNAGNLQVHKILALIKLREFVEDGRSLSYSLERYLEQCWQLSTVETQSVLKQGRALVLLDGLDEVTEENGETITKQIKRFVRTYPHVQMVVTCRTQSFTGESDWKSRRFSFVEVADFNEPQVRSFAEHWFKTVMGDEAGGLAKGQEFLEQLFREENKPIRELAITPILLSLTCAMFHQTGKFYSKRSKLYEEGLELLLEHWDKSREIERDEIYRDLSIERKLELLSYLAVKKFEQEQYVLFEQEEIEGYVAEFLGVGRRESRAVLSAIESQHGLLIERATKVWSFSHLTFQEYLAAKWFSNVSNFRSLCVHTSEYHWREIFLLVAELTLHSAELLELMRTSAQHYIQSPKLQHILFWADQVEVILQKCTPADKRASAVLILSGFIPERSGYNRYIFHQARTICRLLNIDCSFSYFDIYRPFGFKLIHHFRELNMLDKMVFENLLIELKNLEEQIETKEILIDGKSISFINIEPEIYLKAYDLWLDALRLKHEDVHISEEEIKSFSKYLYINALILRCQYSAKEASSNQSKTNETILTLYKGE